MAFQSSLLVSNAQRSVLRTQASALDAFDCHGWRNASTPGPALGFNGQRPEPQMGRYHLGHGRRVYNPVLRRFHEPDKLSPFAAGGLNAYAYCQGDPVNYRDPSGSVRIEWMHGDFMQAIPSSFSVAYNSFVFFNALATMTSRKKSMRWNNRLEMYDHLIGAPLAAASGLAGMLTSHDEAVLVGMVVAVFNASIFAVTKAPRIWKKIREPGARARMKINFLDLGGVPVTREPIEHVIPLSVVIIESPTSVRRTGVGSSSQVPPLNTTAWDIRNA